MLLGFRKFEDFRDPFSYNCVMEFVLCLDKPIG